MENQAATVIVSGLPRSGTSLMMQMLEAAGQPVLADGVRAADEDNPRGYVELEPVKRTAVDASWLDGARGMAVKVISHHLVDLPVDRPYHVIFMRRRLGEVMASQRAMLRRRGEPIGDSDADMERRFAAHLQQVERWLRDTSGVQTLFASYNRLMTEPATVIPRICEFLGEHLTPEAMFRAIDPTLYRQRG